MSCEFCNHEHTADPFFCIARLKEKIEIIKESARNLDWYIIEHPEKVLEIPDEIYIPFMNAVELKW